MRITDKKLGTLAYSITAACTRVSSICIQVSGSAHHSTRICHGTIVRDMTTATAALISATASLLLTVQASPTADTSIKEHAIEVARQAIRIVERAQESDLTRSASSFETRSVPYTLVADGDGRFSGAVPYDSKRAYVVKSDAEWQDLWTRVRHNWKPEPVPPEIDFSTDMIIAVIDEPHPSIGYGIGISEIIETETSLEVYAQGWGPIEDWVYTQTPAQPYRIVKIKRSEKEVVFLPADHFPPNENPGK